jgi:hypothetical protein
MEQDISVFCVLFSVEALFDYRMEHCCAALFCMCTVRKSSAKFNPVDAITPVL